ncbi:DUF6069 family protein [Actinoplanes sp. NPDC051861]|uniref:DUF6069 family protein n=1 Tax=Actinoplanes sp. NPDC051861 TaxID=3155170 RepID=UPI00341A6714
MTAKGNYRLRVVAAAVVAAEVAYLVLWAVGVDLVLASGGTVGAVQVAAASAVASFAGWVVLALLERFTGRARRAWTMLAAVVFGLSLFGTAGGDGTAAVVGLSVLHSVVAVVLIAALPRCAGFTRRAADAGGAGDSGHVAGRAAAGNGR